MPNNSKPTKSVVKKWAFGDDYFNGDKYKSRQAAFNAARNAGRGVFVWKGNRYNTMTPEDNPEKFLKDHADYDYYLANLAKKEEGIDDKWKDNRFRDNEEKALSRAKAIQYHWVPKQYAPLSTPTELAQSANNIKFKGYTRTPAQLATFTNDDIRNLNFHDFAGMEKAVKNQGNANNAFAKSMLARYGYGRWDQEQVEKDLNVKGRYNSFGGGDLGDISRNQASWLGTRNGSINTPNLEQMVEQYQKDAYNKINPFGIKSSLL